MIKNNIITIAILAALIACSPTVKVEAPDKPIVIDLNVNVKIQVERDLDKAIKGNKEIF